jgi:electron transfer flavoprotein alpha subunit
VSAILALVEHANGAADRLSLEMLALAGRLGRDLGLPVRAVLVGDGAAAAATLGGYGVAAATVVEHPRLDAYAPVAWAAALGEIAGSAGALAVLAPGSERGTEVLAHLAARTGGPMAANVVDVPDHADATDGGRWRIVRQRWAGSLLEEAWLEGSPRLLTVAAHAVAPGEPVAGAPAPEITRTKPDLADADLRVRVTGHDVTASDRVSLTDARVVVGGGRGIGSAEGFAMLEDLAGLLGGAVGVSRVVTSAGWRPHSEQIGQTGVRIAPDLYIACGISGAIQHIVGARAAKRILAINTDADAPIMAVADYAVIGDLHQVVPAISAEVRRVTGR